MEHADLFLRFGIAIAIGFMIGLQREFAHGGVGREIIAGERTLALVGAAGCLAAMTADLLGSPLGFIAVIFPIGVFAAIAYYVQGTKGHIGLTTEVAIMIVVGIGAISYWGYLTLAAALGIATTALLSLKIETDQFVRALTREDIMAALQLAVISAIVLPVLPNQSLFAPPFDVLNPFKIWLMVVFISGISFLGYVLIKWVGPQQGIGLTGFLGGLVSSTAVTLSFSERSNKETGLAKPFALAITVSWTVMFARVLVEVGVVNQALLKVVWLPVAAAGAAGLAYCAYLFLSERAGKSSDVDFSNPFDLSAAVKFGLLYGVVLLVSRTAQLYFGDTGVFLSSIISGLADVDAVTLTMAELSRSGALDLAVAAKAIVLAAMSNTVVKSSIVLMGGAPALRKTLLPGLALMLAAGIGVAFLV
ncbi:MAG: DUF4010 domain-containing protein [Anaerolineae bacterium]|nr:DUF4010 domain-containing protein [Anaerolineae bacterium]